MLPETRLAPFAALAVLDEEVSAVRVTSHDRDSMEAIWTILQVLVNWLIWLTDGARITVVSIESLCSTLHCNIKDFL